MQLNPSHSFAAPGCFHRPLPFRALGCVVSCPSAASRKHKLLSVTVEVPHPRLEVRASPFLVPPSSFLQYSPLLSNSPTLKKGEEKGNFKKTLGFGQCLTPHSGMYHLCPRDFSRTGTELVQFSPYAICIPKSLCIWINREYTFFPNHFNGKLGRLLYT